MQIKSLYNSKLSEVPIMNVCYSIFIIYFAYSLENIKAAECPDCPENEILYECKSPCQPTCQQPFRPPCYTFACQSGCDCKPGYIRDEVSQKCISPSCCPVACGENEVPNNGNNECEQTCQDNILKVQCVSQNKRCVCRPGLVRDLNSGKCIARKYCPKDCGKNEEWNWCTSLPCRKTCQNRYSEPDMCPAVCRPGCQCKTGYIFDEACGECVLEKQCPKPQCGTNQEWSECSNINTPCKPSCSNIDRPIPCPAKLCKPGCSCTSGYLWDQQQKKCVRKPDCSKLCTENQEWKECSDVQCRETCQRRKPRICTKLCASGCSCKNGYIWDEHYKKCVPRWQCSKVCGINEEWCDFIPDDETTCQSLVERPNRECSHIDPTFVTLRPGCSCKEGYVWDESTHKCVEPEYCFTAPTTKKPIGSGTTIVPTTKDD